MPCPELNRIRGDLASLFRLSATVPFLHVRITATAMQLT
jgi:hypothetical protein